MQEIKRKYTMDKCSFNKILKKYIHRFKECLFIVPMPILGALI